MPAWTLPVGVAARLTASASGAGLSIEEPAVC
jgi:hypothetical protein